MDTQRPGRHPYFGAFLTYIFFDTMIRHLRNLYKGRSVANIAPNIANKGRMGIIQGSGEDQSQY